MEGNTKSRRQRVGIGLILLGVMLLLPLICPNAASAHPDNAEATAASYRYEEDVPARGLAALGEVRPQAWGYPHYLADPLEDKGTEIKTSDGDHWAGTFNLDWNRSYIVPVFCLDLEHSTESGECYGEDGPTVPSVTWLLSNGYGPDDAMTDNEAAAYQAAVWHYTDGLDLDGGSPTPSGVKTIYDDTIAACEAAKPWPLDQQNIEITLEPNGQIFLLDGCTYPHPYGSPLTVPMTVTVTDAGQAVVGKTLSIQVMNLVGTLSTNEVTTNASGQAFFSITHDEGRWTALVRVYGQFQIAAGVTLEPETSGVQRLLRGASYTGTRDAEATVTWVCGGRLVAHKFYDSNLNGVQDSGEANIEGWMMFRRGCAGSHGGWDPRRLTNAIGDGGWDPRRLTNAIGDAIWGVETPTCLDVKEERRPAWLPTTPTQTSVNIPAGGTATVYFGNAKKPIIEVYKFWDQDGDGKYDPGDGETLLTDWWFDLYWWTGSNWNLRASQMTGPDGKVVWTGYTGITETGDFKVVERLQPGWVATTPGGDSQTVTISSWSHKKLWFGNSDSACEIHATLSGGDECMCELTELTLTVDTSRTSCTGTLHYTWYLDGSPIPGPDAPSYSTSTAGTYRVLVECKDGGETKCDAWTNEATIAADTEKPTFDNCPEDLTLDCNASLPPPTVTASDNCDADVDVQLTSETSDEYACETVWHRTWTATDDCGNTVTCTQHIHIPTDTEKPTFDNCPAHVTLGCNVDLPAAPTVTASDNCDDDVDVQLTSQTSDEYDCETVWHRTWTATDDCSNTATCTQHITIFNDSIPPIIIDCPEDVTLDRDAELPDPPTLTAIDNCYVDKDVQLTSETSDEYACETVWHRTWTAMDWCGCSATCMQHIHIPTDTEKPTFDNCPEDMTLDCNADLPAPPTVTASDQCDDDVDVAYEGQTLISSGCEKIYRRTWTATDDFGNTVTCTQHITIPIDSINPWFDDCPEDMTLDWNAELPAAPTLTASDNCDTDVDVVLTGGSRNYQCHTVYYRFWTATDDCGNTKTCTQQITIPRDTQAPWFTIWHSDETLWCNATLPPPPSVWAADNCDHDVDVELTETYDEYDCETVYHRTWTATDDCGNTVSRTQNVTIPTDTEKPTFDNCPADVTLDCNADLPAASTVTASDNCDDDVDVQLTSQTSDEYDCETVYHREWTATDDCGNTVTCTQNITIPLDGIKPWFDDCPADMSLDCNAELPDPPTVTAFDNCDDDVDVQLTSETSDEYPCETVWHREWTATDYCGNAVTCTQNITIPVDTTKPVFDHCPEDTTLECNAPLPSGGYLTASDNCDGPVPVRVSDLIRSTSCAWVIERTWTASDACGNTATCTQTITVPKDTTKPTFDNCPEDRTLDCNADLPAAPTVTASDNCDDDVDVQLTSEKSDEYACETVWHRTWTATDDCGNAVTCTQHITIPIDTQKPAFDNCPADVTLDCNAEVPETPTVTASDNCDLDVDVQLTSQTSDEYACETVWHRAWTATDYCGNAVTCTQHITIPVDTQKPTFDNCPEHVLLGCFATLPVTPTVTASDNCDQDVDVQVELTLDYQQTTPCFYVYRRTWTATDDCGNTVTCTQGIYMPYDDTPPDYVNCPPDITVGFGESTHPWETGRVDYYEYCDPRVAWHSDDIIGTCPTVIERTWFAGSECGPKGSCVQVITITTVPQVTVNDDEVCSGGSGLLTATTVPATGVSYLWNTLETTKSIAPTAAGTYTVTVTWDATQCQASGSGILTVHDGPTAAFTSDSPVYLTEVMHFTDLSSAGDWPIDTWEWDFGDTMGTSNDPSPEYTYAAAGTYMVTLKVTDEYGCTDEVQYPVTVGPWPTWHICGYVYLDGATTGLPGAVVDFEVREEWWKSKGTYTTCADGFFEFYYTGLMGMFRLTETNPPGYESTLATAPWWGEVMGWDLIRYNDPKHVDDGGPDLCPFVFYDKLPPGPGASSIGDYVWHDKSWDGIQDPDEDALPSIMVLLKQADGTPITSAETNANGLYLFDGLTAGTYRVEVDVDDPELPYGFIPTTSSNIVYDLGVEEDYRDADFGFAAECPTCPDWITFHTDRDGNWEVYRLGSELLNLTDDPATDMGPTRSPDATTVAYQSNRNGNWDIFLVHADGSGTHELTFDPANDVDPNWSGECATQRIAFQSDRDGQWEIYVINQDGSGLQRVTFNDAADTDPFWSPDCAAGKIAFQSDRNGAWNIYVVDVTTLDERLLVDNPGTDVDPVWSPDGESIAFISDRDGQGEVYVVDVATGAEIRITFSESDEKNVAWSPDSMWLAYQSNRDGQWELYVARSNGQQEMRVTEDASADESPSWDCGSEWLVFHTYRDGDPEIYGINAMTGQGLHRKTDDPANDLCPMWMPTEEDGSLIDITPARGLILAKGW